MQNYTQQPQYPYPAQQPQTYPVQQYMPPQYFQPQITPEQQREKTYRRLLRKNVNSVGMLLLLFFGAEMIFSIIVISVLSSYGLQQDSASGELFLLENGVISVCVFFLVGLIYCLIRRLRFSSIFPFDKIGGGLLAQLVVIGLSFSLMSNYVVSLVDNTFGLFGIENNGGTFDVGDQPNILLYVLVVAILPAFAEEFAFRGVVMGVIRPYSEGLAILISSAAFALMHGNFVQMPFTFCCGLVFGFIVVKTNSLLPSILIHFLNNGLSVLSDILISYQILDETTANLYYGVIFVITGILSFIFLKKLVNTKDGSFFSLKNGNTALPYKTKVKTAVTSPTLICYTVIMVIYSIAELILGV